jgi:toxin ParE1/3/4
VNVVITDEAEYDFERIGDYIEQFNQARAVTFVEELLERCMRLASFPTRFALVARHESAGIRRMPHGNYVVYYKVGQDRVEILRILNAAQDHEAILFPDETHDH